MWPFNKKTPAALKKHGWLHLFYVILVVVLTFLPFFSLSYVFASMELGWLFYEEGGFIFKPRDTFNELYHDAVFTGHIVSPLLFPLVDAVNMLVKDDREVSDSAPFLILSSVILIGHFFLYKEYIFDRHFAPYFVHPHAIKKTFFRNIINSFKKLPLSENSFAAVFVWFVVLVSAVTFLLANPDKYYAFWEWFSDVFTIFAPIFLVEVIAKLTIPFFILYVSLAIPITWQIFTESRVLRRLSNLGKPSARWGGVGSYIVHDFDTIMKRNRKAFWRDPTKTAPIYLGTTTFSSDPHLGGRHFGLDSHTHMLTIAQTGAGKSRDVLHNNIPIWPHGMFILDPKGEHAMRTYEIRKKAGFPVYLLDPYGLCEHIAETDCLNPLDEIDPNRPSAADDIQAITYACIPPDDKETGNAKHFRETAQMLFAGIVAHVLTRYPKEEQTLVTVFDLYLSGKPDGTLVNKDGFYKVLGEMAGNPACGKLPIQGVKMLLDVKEGERGSIYSTFMRSVSWTQTEAVRKVLGTSTFSLDEIKQRKATVYVVLPFGYMKPQARWIRTLLGLAFKRAEFPIEETQTRQISLFILDEFLQLETCKAVQDAFITLRGAGVKLWLLSQSLSEFKEYYSNHEAMIGACDKQFFGTDGKPDCKYIEEILGEYQKIIEEGFESQTRSHREIDNLCTASEVSHLIGQVEKGQVGEGYQIVKPTNSLPVILNLVPCFWNFAPERYGVFKEKFLRPPLDNIVSDDPENEKEYISSEEVKKILEGERAGRPIAKTTIEPLPKAGEKGPLRQSLDALEAEIKQLREEIDALKKV